MNKADAVTSPPWPVTFVSRFVASCVLFRQISGRKAPIKV